MPQGATGSSASVRSLIKDKLAIDNHVLDTLVILERIGISGTVDDTIRIQYRDVGEHSRLEQAAIVNPQLNRTERGHFADGIFESQEPALADVHTQHSRERAEVARMWLATAQRSFGGECGAV